MSKRRLTLAAILVLYLGVLSLVTFQTVNDNRGLTLDGTTVLARFWDLQFGAAGQPITVTTLTLALFTALPAYLAITIHNNHSFYNVHQRLGYQRFLTQATVATFTKAALLSACSALYQLGLIFALVRRLPSNVMLPAALRLGLTPFNDNTLLGVAVFILLSAIGWGVFSVFVFSAGLFVRKNALFLVLGAALGTALIIGPALLLPIGHHDLRLAYILDIIMPPTLFAPGQLTLAVFNGDPPNVYLAFGLALGLYSTVAWWLQRRWVARQRARG